jgi:hypothetical protein
MEEDGKGKRNQDEEKTKTEEQKRRVQKGVEGESF